MTTDTNQISANEKTPEQASEQTTTTTVTADTSAGDAVGSAKPSRKIPSFNTKGIGLVSLMALVVGGAAFFNFVQEDETAGPQSSLSNNSERFGSATVEIDPATQQNIRDLDALNARGAVENNTSYIGVEPHERIPAGEANSIVAAQADTSYQQQDTGQDTGTNTRAQEIYEAKIAAAGPDAPARTQPIGSNSYQTVAQSDPRRGGDGQQNPQSARFLASQALIAQFSANHDGQRGLSMIRAAIPEENNVVSGSFDDQRVSGSLGGDPALDQNGDDAAGTNRNGQTGDPVIRAYRRFYGHLQTLATSDVPGPMVVELVEGPLSGGRLLGQLSVTANGLGITFTNIEFDGGVIPVQAVAIDPVTSSPNIATKYDSRWLQRALPQLAATFASGYLVAQAVTPRTVVVGSAGGATTIEEEPSVGDALASGGAEVTRTLAEEWRARAQNIQPLRARPADTGLGVLFLSPVYLPEGQ